MAQAHSAELTRKAEFAHHAAAVGEKRSSKLSRIAFLRGRRTAPAAVAPSTAV
jgi:hypothetical protein